MISKKNHNDYKHGRAWLGWAGRPAEPCQAPSERMAEHGWAGPGARPKLAEPLSQGMVGHGRTWLGLAGHGRAWLGWAGHGWAGPGGRPSHAKPLSERMAGHGWAGPGARPRPAEPLSQGMVGHGRAWLGLAGHGRAWLGCAGHGWAWGRKATARHPCRHSGFHVARDRHEKGAKCILGHLQLGHVRLCDKHTASGPAISSGIAATGRHAETCL